MHWSIILVVGILAVALIFFLVVRNQRDKNKFATQLKNDYPKPGDGERDIEIDNLTDSVH